MMSPTGYLACYDGDHPARPVVAWREGDGAALIVDKVAGRLVVASEYVTLKGATFLYLMPAEDPIVAVAPGQGWSVQVDDDTSVPVIVFATNAEGFTMPILTGVDGSPEGYGRVVDFPHRTGLIPPGTTEGRTTP